MKLRRRSGFTLLELVVVTTLMGITIASIAMLMRTSLSTWDAFESDQSRLEAIHAMVRHMVRGLRQANTVNSMTSSTDPLGNIEVKLGNGSTARWYRSGSTVFYELGGVGNPLCEASEFYVSGMKADGTSALSASEVRAVRITAVLTLTGNGTGQRRVQSTAWLRVKPGT